MDSQQRKNTASFYTKPQVAEFLAALTLPSEEVLPSDWKDWKIADFACGTGSLLRAGYRRLIHFSNRQGNDSCKFHRYMMENNLCGLDVSAIAAHLSATTIVNLFPSVSYDTMQIGKVSFGVEEGQTYAGSLELSEKSSGNKLFDTHFTSLKGAADGEGVSRIDAPDKSFAAVIMNPPYSRTRGGQAVADLSGISDSDRFKIQKRISKLRKNTLGNGKAGLASDFISLAGQKLANGGRMGFVLPLTVSASGSYKKIRKYLLNDFSDITVVFFGEGILSGGESLSDDTGMEEIMLIATKGKVGRDGVRYVKLDNPFDSASVAMETARLVWSTEDGIASGETKGVLYAGSDRIGEWLYAEHPPSVWGLAGSSDIHGFSSLAELLAGGNLDLKSTHASFPVIPLSSLLGVGSTHHNIGFLAQISSKQGTREGVRSGAFRWHEITSETDGRKEDLAMWHAKHDSCVSVLGSPSHYGTEYNSDKIQKMREEKTDMFIQRNMTWASQKALVGRTAIDCFGGRSWCGLSHTDTIIKDAFSVWGNSIFGFAVYWTQAQRQQPGRACMQIADTKQLLVPDFSDTEMYERAKRVLAYVDTDDLFSNVLDRANLCISDPHRQKFNKIAADLLGIPEDQQAGIIDYLQESWTSEPSVTP